MFRPYNRFSRPRGTYYRPRVVHTGTMNEGYIVLLERSRACSAITTILVKLFKRGALIVLVDGGKDAVQQQKAQDKEKANALNDIEEHGSSEQRRWHGAKGDSDSNKSQQHRR